MMTKKKKRPTQKKQPETVSLSIGKKVPTAEEEEKARELKKFLND